MPHPCSLDNDKKQTTKGASHSNGLTSAGFGECAAAGFPRGHVPDSTLNSHDLTTRCETKLDVPLYVLYKRCFFVPTCAACFFSEQSPRGLSTSRPSRQIVAKERTEAPIDDEQLVACSRFRRCGGSNQLVPPPQLGHPNLLPGTRVHKLSQTAARFPLHRVGYSLLPE